MNVINPTTTLFKPLKSQPSHDVKKATPAMQSELAPVAKKTPSATFSMVLSEKQKDTLHQSLGYDKPGHKQKGAVNAYLQIASQQKRDEIMESMGFHFVV
ncbi:hypothetical protein PCNPT3_07455 [Psychromonas sp. CNPT3]|uniref:hypothetical protein n=1 Tax=Psychromonas sp. CNPT3 TaxID=314282 RepID=UPI00006E85BA|nr:hypothetical protein [Psychromonas sp. CNPT3]AGH81429.1 hypothetical protein PCNPT3_07455 [Psychromonas sp. CNPT3]